MKLVDTSSWIHFLRRDGTASVRGRVVELLANGDAAWCPIVRLELWAGSRSPSDRKSLAELESRITDLTMSADVWDASCRLAARARDRGVTVPPHDVAIAACAAVHGVEIEHADRHLDLLIPLSVSKE
jgi:predicted nucleic acid-binding protein